MTRSLFIVSVATSLLLCGCAAVPSKSDSTADFASLPPPPAAEPGAIYAAGQGMALFEDQKARNIGDLVTVLLVEKTQARKSAATNTNKDQSVELGDVTVLGKGVDFDTGISGKRSFKGSGDSTQSNSLSGSLTATVVQRYPNGNLLIRGEKLLQLNQGSEVLRLEGVVRPSDISTNNTVASDRVANARVTYAGKGALADANTQGWLARFFNSPWVPF